MLRRGSLALVLLVAAIAGCGSRSKLNHFVLPDGYTGLVAVVSDPRLSSDTYRDGERYVHKVPASGVVCEKTDRMFRPRFRTSAVYADGTQVFSNVVGQAPPPSGDSTRIEPLGSWGSSIEEGYLHWFGVGTEAEVETLKSLVLGDSEEVHLGFEMNTRIPRHPNDDFFHLRVYCGKQ
jgi:hypothetical protein